MRLILTTEGELQEALVKGAAVWRTPNKTCDDDAAPPSAVLQRSLEHITAEPALAAWFLPRLFWAEDVAAVVGSGSFKTAPSYPEGVEIGYGVGVRHQGNGYATMGVRLMLAEAFTLPHVTEIYAEAKADNLASIRVLQKCGLTPDGEKLDSNDGRILRFHLFRP